MKRLTNLIIIFFTLTIFINFGYFYFYYKFLDLEMGIMNIVFNIITISLIFLFFLFLKKLWWLILNCIFLVIINLFIILNFAHFSVFDTFFTPSITISQASNFVLIKFLFEYVNLIPWQLYLLTCVVTILQIIIYITIYKLRNSTILKKVQSKINLLNKTFYKQNVLHISEIFVLVLFVLTGILLLGFNSYASSHQKDSWWDQKSYIQDVGIYGFLYQKYSNNSKNTLVLTQDSSLDIEDLTPSQKIKAMLNDIAIAYTPSTQVKPQTYQSPNIIFYQLESIDDWIKQLNPSPLLFLEKLTKENISVTQFYGNSCDTINAEYSTLCSNMPDVSDPVNYKHLQNNYTCLPEILSSKKEYRTALFHSGYIDFYNRDILSKKWGFQETYFNDIYAFKLPDDFVIKDMLNKMTQTPEKPFFAYLIGFSGHSPHEYSQIESYEKYFGQKLDIYDGNIPQNILNSIEIKEDSLRVYATFAQYVDKSIKYLFDELKSRNLLNNTIVVLYADHRYYNFYSDDLVQDFYNFNELPFVIYTPEQMHTKIKNISSHIDIAPTILDLLGMDIPNSFVGTSLFDNNKPNSVITKCNNSVEYVDDNVIIHGNFNNNQFKSIHSLMPITIEETQVYFEKIKNTVLTSDQYLNENLLFTE